MKIVALGMVPQTTWNDRLSAYGGYIVVRNNGELVCYHLYNEDAFKDYLFNDTGFDTPSCSRYKFGSIYDDHGSLFINLNLQIRFNDDGQHIKRTPPVYYVASVFKRYEARKNRPFRFVFNGLSFMPKESAGKAGHCFEKIQNCHLCSRLFLARTQNCKKPVFLKATSTSGKTKSNATNNALKKFLNNLKNKVGTSSSSENAKRRIWKN